MSENERRETVLSPGQDKALLSLLQADSIREASRQARISEAQIYRYLKEKPFIEAYRQARRKSLEVAIRKLETLASQAIETLREVMQSQDSTPSQRIYASKTILDLAFKIRENDIIERIEQLEERIK